MKRKYIKPSIINYFLLADSALLAGSGRSTGADQHLGGDLGSGAGTGNSQNQDIGTGSGDGLAKQQYNAWEAWDEF